MLAYINQMAISAGNVTMTSAKFNTVVVYHGTYRCTLLNTLVYRGTLFFAVPSPSNLERNCFSSVFFKMGGE